MHKYHKQAELLVVEVIKELNNLLPNGGENISCFNPGIMNDLIRNLISVKVLLACANEAEGLNAEKPK